MAAFGEQVEIEVGQDQAEGIGILGFLDYSARPFDPQPVFVRFFQRAFEKSRGGLLKHREHARAIAGEQLDFLRAGLECADHRAAILDVAPEQRERIVEPALDHRGRRRAQRPVVRRHSASPPSRSRAARASPQTGTSIQSGRLAASYETS